MIKYLWQLPQHLIGFLISLFCDSEVIKGKKIWLWGLKSGVSLGRYVIVNRNCSMNTINHELGHSQQSLYLGPLYLILIGLPSAIGNLISRISPWLSEHYYEQPWEKWADRLGGVNRK